MESMLNGTQTATIGTEHSLATVSGVGTYVLMLDTSNMANGDTLEVRVKSKVLSGGAEVLYLFATYLHVQAEPLKMTIPVPSLHSLTATLKQTAGTGRAYEWNLVRL